MNTKHIPTAAVHDAGLEFLSYCGSKYLLRRQLNDIMDHNMSKGRKHKERVHLVLAVNIQFNSLLFIERQITTTVALETVVVICIDLANKLSIQ